MAIHITQEYVTQRQPIVLVRRENMKTIKKVSESYVGDTPIATSITSSSTNDEVAGAKAVYDVIGQIETILQTLNSGSGVQ